MNKIDVYGSPLEYLESVFNPVESKMDLQVASDHLYDYVSSLKNHSPDVSFVRSFEGLKRVLASHKKEESMKIKSEANLNIKSAERFCRDQSMSLVWYKFDNSPTKYVVGVANNEFSRNDLPIGSYFKFSDEKAF